MGVSVLLQSLATSTFFASRPFVTVFAVAWLARFGPRVFAAQAAEQRATMALYGPRTLLNCATWPGHSPSPGQATSWLVPSGSNGSATVA